MTRAEFGIRGFCGLQSTSRNLSIAGIPEQVPSQRRLIGVYTVIYSPKGHCIWVFGTLLVLDSIPVKKSLFSWSSNTIVAISYRHEGANGLSKYWPCLHFKSHPLFDERKRLLVVITCISRLSRDCRNCCFTDRCLRLQFRLCVSFFEHVKGERSWVPGFKPSRPYSHHPN